MILRSFNMSQTKNTIEGGDDFPKDFYVLSLSSFEFSSLTASFYFLMSIIMHTGNHINMNELLCTFSIKTNKIGESMNEFAIIT